MQDTCCSDCNNLLKGEKVAEMDKNGQEGRQLYGGDKIIESKVTRIRGEHLVVTDF